MVYSVYVIIKRMYIPTFLYKDVCEDVKRSRKIKCLFFDLLGQPVHVWFVHIRILFRAIERVIYVCAFIFCVVRVLDPAEPPAAALLSV